MRVSQLCCKGYIIKKDGADKVSADDSADLADLCQAEKGSHEVGGTAKKLGEEGDAGRGSGCG